MKIAQIINTLNIGGAENLVVESLPFFKNKLPNTDLFVLKKTDSYLSRSLSSDNIPFKFLTEGSLYNPLIIFKIIPILRKYDIIHFHLFPTLYWVVIAKIISFSNTKLIFTEHNTNNQRRNKKRFKLIERFIYSKVDKIVTIADEVDEKLKQHLNFEDYKFVKIYNGVYIKKFSNAEVKDRSLFNFKKDDRLIIQVSSFRKQKDQETLIKSLLFLPDNFKVLLVGDGPLKSELENLTKDNNLSERVMFLGLRNDVPNLLKMCDYVILSSNHEGLSLASIEGMASGKPFIASKVPGLTEIVDKYGLLFNKGDEKDLSSKIISLENNIDFKEDVVKRCLHRANQFDIMTMVDKYIDLYKKMI